MLDSLGLARVLARHSHRTPQLQGFSPAEPNFVQCEFHPQDELHRIQWYLVLAELTGPTSIERSTNSSPHDAFSFLLLSTRIRVAEFPPTRSRLDDHHI